MARRNDSTPHVGNISMEGVRILFRNFAGEPDKYNKTGGKRTFSILLNEETAAQLMEEGWNIKPLRAREEDDEPHFHLPIEVSYKLYPPRIYLIAGKRKTELKEDTVSTLDYAEISNVDITIRPYCWEVNEKCGVKAYVKNMYVTIVEDEFEKKYRDLGDEDDDTLPF